jgi:ABC-type nitrate/sulfonate/bicarbonate transport system ATPase subunit
MNSLELEGLTIKRGGYTAVSGLELAARPGDCLLVFGRYGSGKQSLLQAVAGVLEPTAGAVRIRDSRPGPRLPVGYVPLKGLLSNLSLLDNAVLPAVYHDLLGRRDAEERALALFEGFSLAAQARRRPRP